VDCGDRGLEVNNLKHMFSKLTGVLKKSVLNKFCPPYKISKFWLFFHPFKKKMLVIAFGTLDKAIKIKI